LSCYRSFFNFFLFQEARCIAGKKVYTNAEDVEEQKPGHPEPALPIYATVLAVVYYLKFFDSKTSKVNHNYPEIVPRQSELENSFRQVPVVLLN